MSLERESRRESEREKVMAQAQTENNRMKEFECNNRAKEFAASMERVLSSTADMVEATTSASPLKKRKLAVSNADHDHRGFNSPEISNRTTLSLCSSNGSGQSPCHGVRSVDLEGESLAGGMVTEISTLINCRFSRETTPSSEISVNTDELESSTATKTSTASLRRKYPSAQMPAAEEIDDFFSTAEKYEQKRFAEKYNYDVVKDAPLEGRYQWVRLKQ